MPHANSHVFIVLCLFSFLKPCDSFGGPACKEWCRQKQNCSDPDKIAAATDCKVCEKYGSESLCTSQKCWNNCQDLGPSTNKDALLFPNTKFNRANPTEVVFSWTDPKNSSAYEVQYRDLVAKNEWTVEIVHKTSYVLVKTDICQRLEIRVRTITPTGVGTFLKFSADIARPELTLKLLNKSFDETNEKTLFEIEFLPAAGWKDANLALREEYLDYHPIECSSGPADLFSEYTVRDRVISARFRTISNCKVVVLALFADTRCGNNISLRKPGQLSIDLDRRVNSHTRDECNVPLYCKANISFQQSNVDCERNISDVSVSWTMDNEATLTSNIDKCNLSYYVIDHGYSEKRSGDVDIPSLNFPAGNSEVIEIEPSKRSYTVNNVNLAKEFTFRVCAVYGANITRAEVEKRMKNKATSKFVVPNECREAHVKMLNMALYILIPSGFIVIALLAVCCMIKHWKQQTKLRNMKRNFEKTMKVRYLQFPERPNVHDKWEVDRRKLLIDEKKVLGKGAFGKVYEGLVKGTTITAPVAMSAIATDAEKAHDLVVAVKQCYEFADQTTKEDFIKEIKLMKLLYYHQSLVNILHCITDSEPYCLIVEFCPGGDLLHYLRSCCKYMLKLQSSGVDLCRPTGTEDYDESHVIFYRDVMQMAHQISDGMNYLSQKGFIHRDLAARNVMVDKNKNVKIGDFGLCRYVYTDSIYLAKGGKLPIKWMAPESIERYEFTAKSDVWSYGVLLFEIVTLGQPPYVDIMPLDGDFRRAMIEHLITERKRFEQPKNCPDDIFEVIQCTWDHNPDERSTFADIRETLRKHIERINDVEGYYGDSYVDATRCYYNISAYDGSNTSYSTSRTTNYKSALTASQSGSQQETNLFEVDLNSSDAGLNNNVDDVPV